MLPIGEPISTTQLIDAYQSSTALATLYTLQLFAGSLSYGPVLILSIVALKGLRKRRSPSALSSSPLFIIILAQLFFVTLRPVCLVGIYVLSFKDSRFIVLDDGRIQKLFVASIRHAELGFFCVAAFAARAVEVLATVVLVRRACTIYTDRFWIQCMLIFAWFLDFAVQAFYFGAYVQMYTAMTKKKVDMSRHLAQIALYASRWSSFALNLFVTLLIGYCVWKYKNILTNAGLATRKSTIYHVLARLVETGVLLLAVQLLIAVLATAYISGDPENHGYIAMMILGEMSLIVINAHPAAMSLVSADIVSKEERRSVDVEFAAVANNSTFGVTDTQVSTELPRSFLASVHTEK
ncbi:hypothetical protein DL96DRAFT_1627186 [Flagelloscypha sp. PMI_526]|nr:hypothetical protein DL96DRAFT_1627186 [Flagelloscypha sp. PMI_526]